MSSRLAGRRLEAYIRARDKGICVYCKEAVGQEMEHVMPHGNGGPTIAGNLVLACKSCNHKKSNSRNLLRMMEQGFIYLRSVGESLDWTDGCITHGGAFSEVRTRIGIVHLSIREQFEQLRKLQEQREQELEQQKEIIKKERLDELRVLQLEIEQLLRLKKRRRLQKTAC
jgi:hypothetical protein